MTIDIFTATGTKKGTLDLPAVLFGAVINQGLMHQAIVRQQSNRRNSIAHAKNRNEVAGSTRKLYAQKGTGRARRGSIRSPLLRGGGKAFGPRSEANFTKDMPKAMRRAALFSCLSLQAKNKAIIGLESYPETIKTKTLAELLKKLPVNLRRVLFVIPEKHESLWLSCRNLQSVKTIDVAYLNPEDILMAKTIVFVGDSVQKAEQIFGTRVARDQKAKKELDTPHETKKKTAPTHKMLRSHTSKASKAETAAKKKPASKTSAK
jgi:large subunit ribosomal protein L4